ncbi:type II toxin-antitoxin system HicA family toxin [Klebsiella pneumoniae]|uniref:type II toxin-antitoxin system HicA family toxin n=1 Tax=Klebsiella pneumoniae TaxID=573 RepID=UPI0010380541|nr:type II toxin-antitoxin system HicA family toxin [Klebsiella pneumoniae]TBO71571.1 type II toxin-antitoxin system HicA family toxin [Klebsiella pneumoniae]TBO81463.1 type II toxin-antitoxin system HicA family toxin [Klebsiella pneumoniae]TBP52135.1 type II toxin-antitoxin system HicA family toxin [Klebsiella pneumoniae]
MFGRKLSPLKYAEVVRALQALGFVMKPKTGTAHEQWIRKTETSKHVVTVDKHNSPFSRDLIKSMAKQAGVDARKFHALCKGECSLKDIGFEPAE